MILMASWETVLGFASLHNAIERGNMRLTIILSTSIIGLINGGTAGLIWMYLVAWIGFLAVNISMAEMGSMYAGNRFKFIS